MSRATHAAVRAVVSGGYPETVFVPGEILIGPHDTALLVLAVKSGGVQCIPADDIGCGTPVWRTTEFLDQRYDRVRRARGMRVHAEIRTALKRYAAERDSAAKGERP